MSLGTIVRISNKYGCDASYVLAGGGNTSYKTKDVIYIKGSGTSLATITQEGFVCLDRGALSAITERQYPAGVSDSEREAEVLFAMMAARTTEDKEKGKRPSVETLLHNLLPQKYVLHVHPYIVNAMTCAKNGEAVCAKLFPDSLWIPETQPGYILARLWSERIKEAAAKGKCVDLIFLQNHGVFFAADDEDTLDALVLRVMSAIECEIKAKSAFPDISDTTDAPARKVASRVAPVLRMLFSPEGKSRCIFTKNPEVSKLSTSHDAAKALFTPPTPDHIVYAGIKPLYIDDTRPESIISAWNLYVAEEGRMPKTVIAEGVGMFSLGSTTKEAAIARDVFIDAIKIYVSSKAFGSYSPMSDELVRFIANWEAESYRRGISAGKGSAGSLSDKIAVVTGAAQGFGEGIARSLAAEGASVVIADINEEGAKRVAASLCEQYGTYAAIAFRCDVTDESSVLALTAFAATVYGGIDVFISNAGVVRSGSLDDLDGKTFDFVTKVNYNAYFLCAKYASAKMKLQRLASPDYMSDIIQINSKSGLEGSNKNYAYAGSKFGGIGLTQSFALELAPYGIKVNAVCPGNFLDGPLWSDPENGLFVQYLRSGKVPGAKSIDDVRRYYESKVPLGRGCRVEDVMCAIDYIIRQKYETGQAVPVTGGQIMLN
jgi:rhamnose utilization protein RhaD (predicted bifunctional aldolase and dehydrogenase)/NAD(P)-dependent dehydrogenase (short-subunit alcohol dehydrogenase family)